MGTFPRRIGDEPGDARNEEDAGNSTNIRILPPREHKDMLHHAKVKARFPSVMPVVGDKEDEWDAEKEKSPRPADTSILPPDWSRRYKAREDRAKMHIRSGYGSIMYALVMTLLGTSIIVADRCLPPSAYSVHTGGVFIVFMFAGAAAFLCYLAYELHITKDSLPKINTYVDATSTANPVRNDDGNRQTGDGGMAAAPPPDKTEELRHRRPSAGGGEPPRFLHEERAGQMVQPIVHGVMMNTASLSHFTTSCYLRAGFCIFALGHIAYVIILAVVLYQEKDDGCEYSSTMYVVPIQIIFVIIQTCFIVKYTSIRVRRRSPLMRFGLMHVVATNLCVWIYTLALEVTFSVQSGQEESHPNTQDQHSNNTPTSSQIADRIVQCGSSLLHSASEFLFPCILEYSLIAVACIINMYITLNPRLAQIIMRSLVQATCPAENATQDVHEEDSGVQCFENAYVGMATGLLMFTITLSVMAFYFIAEEQDLYHDESDYVTIVMSLINQTTLLIGVILVGYKLWPFGYTFLRDNSVDATLLLLAFCGYFFYEVFNIVALAADTSMVGGRLALLGTLSVIELCQIVLQTGLILDGLQRFGRNKEQRSRKPGRQVITFLIIVNVAVWFFESLVAKGELSELTSLSLGPQIGALIVSIPLPLVLFYRFHSSILLAEMWHAVYEPEL